jgi:AcrR family transcriptional regulator
MQVTVNPASLPPQLAPADPDVREHRRRLLDAMAQACSNKGFAATTIADLAADARVSKRTFYEHFSSKEDCFIALYESASAHALSVLKTQVDVSRDWHEQVELALSAYFQALAINPMLLRTLFIEILGLGAKGLAARRRVNSELADFIVAVARHCPVENTDIRLTQIELTQTDATGLVGAINELILQAIEEGRADRLGELITPASRLVRVVIDGACNA